MSVPPHDQTEVQSAVAQLGYGRAWLRMLPRSGPAVVLERHGRSAAHINIV